MPKQISSSPTECSIAHLIGSIKREQLILQPEFQRKLVWNKTHKESFIDTILKGFPFPEIYLAEQGIDIKEMNTQQVVVDGQQRLTTIMQYISDNGDNPDFGKTIPKYKDLPEEEQKNFLNYRVVIRDLKDTSSENIKEIFKRINQTKYNLTQVEIQNAIYDGDFIATAKDILDDNSDYLSTIFSDIDISRMSDLNFILTLMATYEENGYYAGNSLTETYIIKYNNEYPQRSKTASLFSTTFTKIKQLNLLPDSIWHRKSNFFTLFLELIHANNTPPDLALKLNNFERNILKYKNDQNSDYGKYYSYMYSGTNSRTARIERASLFKKNILQ